MKLQDAAVADRNGELESAASLYEEVLASGRQSLDVVLDLAILYWQSTDVGMAAAKKLSPEFLAIAGRRISELLAEARERFPMSTEPRFWTRYIAWADLGEPFSKEECWGLLHEEPADLVPAMHIFGVSRGTEAATEALELLRQCEGLGTTRARYVTSVIRGVLKRTGRR